jgi:cytochrome c oxidase subunit 3
MSPDTHAATAPAASGLKHPYHLVDPSPWPLVAALSAGLTVLGGVLAMHDEGFVLLVIGLLCVVGTAAFWWRDVLRESATPGLHGPIVPSRPRSGRRPAWSPSIRSTCRCSTP